MNNLSELSDLEIIKAIAEIENDTHTLETFLFYDAPEHQSDFYQNQREKVILSQAKNPLADDSYCFQLLKKHKVTVEYECAGSDKFPHPCTSIHNGDDWLSHRNDGIEANKAICLTIIEAQRKLAA
ncbi:hypothetical protein [Pseudoalteromonas sp. M8]|uniref:hypothetical protein n=1 Tax=Pseudoalteromonas sp. M8 TaxID=2692624 RepID=UPI001BA75613|nr:hypothetical protein [Pseudoalteromonas sp. M8]QUI71272.1 hypothetical protein GSF13_16610 [Pseudoalteromonas sp. M8]